MHHRSLALLEDWVFRRASLALDAMTTLGQHTGGLGIVKARAPGRPRELRGRPTPSAGELTLALHPLRGVVVVSILLADGHEVASV